MTSIDIKLPHAKLDNELSSIFGRLQFHHIGESVAQPYHVVPRVSTSTIVDFSLH